MSITLVATDADDPLRNFRVYLPGGACERDPTRACDADNPCDQGECIAFEQGDERLRFNPNFVASVRGYGVLRFMDWMQTNGSKQRVWNDRPVIDDPSWAKRGVPLEIMVELANQSGKDPWFCIPHMVDDDYVQRFALYVRDHLELGRKAYIEYSNEVWNDQFEQSVYARNQGKHDALGSSDFESQLRFYARRSTEVHKIFEQVFGGAQRLIRVTSSQGANPWVSNAILSFQDTAAHTDALAIAPYFGSDLGTPDSAGRVDAMSVDQLMAELTDVDLPAVMENVASHAHTARFYGVELVAYEGGQHLVGLNASVDDDRLNALFDAANRDPRMKSVYQRYLDGWRKNGGRLFNHFTSCAASSNYGRWGALEYMDQPRSAAPKFDAILDFIDANPRWW